MPKHVPSFKHLLAGSHAQKKPEKRERTVNERLAESRANAARVRDAPPHVPVASSSSSRHVQMQTRVWVPNNAAVSALAPCGETVIHPAELLRRAEVARRQASRSVAGPVPPPSWRAVPAAAKAGPLIPTDTESTLTPVTKRDLLRAEELFDRSLRSSDQTLDRSGAARLVEYCLHAVLRHMESEQSILDGASDEAGSRGGTGRSDGAGSLTVGQAMREQVGYLDAHLKTALLGTASILPESSDSRLTERSIRAVLAQPKDVDDEEEVEEGGNQMVEFGATSDDDTDLDRDDWSDTSTTLPEIHHLPLTLHPHPISLIRQLPTFPIVSLTSLNLAYATIRDLDKLILELPASLRELGLVGIRLGAVTAGFGMRKGGEEDEWKRGLGALGRKMIVLRMLDLSYPSIPISEKALSALLSPAITKLPSLAVLGLRELVDVGDTSRAEVVSNMVSEINKSGRKRWIDVVVE